MNLKIKEAIGGIKLPARASAWYLGASAVAKLTGVITTPIFTRLINKEDYGRFTLYMTLLGCATVVCSAFCSGSAIYKGLRDYKENEEKYLKSVLWTTLGFSTLICILLFAFSPFLDLNPWLLIPLSLQIFCDGICAIVITKARFYYKYKAATVISLITSLLSPAISALIIYFWNGGYTIRIYVMLFLSICVTSYSLFTLLKNRSKVDIKTLRYTIKSSLPLLPHTISTALSGQADKFIISGLMGAAALAKYSVVYSMGIALQFIVNAIGSALSPWIIRRLDRGDEKRISELILPMTLGYWALSLFLVALSPEALAILAPKDYFDAYSALIPIALSTPLYFVFSVVTVGLIHSGRGGYSALISVIGGGLSLILNYTLIGSYGYWGGGLAILIQQAIVTLIAALLLGRVRKKRLISLPKVLLPGVICAGLCAVIYMLRELLWARCLILLIPTVTLLYCLTAAKSQVIEKVDKIGS